MRRRTLIQAAAAAALTGMLPRSGRAQSPESTLIAFAATVAPGLDSGAWLDKAETGRLRERYAGLSEDEIIRCEAVLAALDKAAGGSFAALGGDERKSLLARLKAEDGGFTGGFARLRALVLDVYFTGGAGLALSGYHDTTQFEGYPEYLRMSREWE